MTELIFSGMTLVAVFYATFIRNMRHAILALWVAGLGVGAIYLTLGAELLAIIQWIISTLMTIAFIFFSVIFGEFHSGRKTKIQNKDLAAEARNKRGDFVLTILSLILGASFATVIWICSKNLGEVSHGVVSSHDDLATVGRILTQENFLSLEVLALLLFLTLVGGGVVARFQGRDRP